MSDQIFAYCERGLVPGVFAEPLNALSNIMFFVAAAVGWRAWRRPPAATRGAFELALIVLVFLIGIGSTLFHTFATRWAAIADTAPIGVFMLAYVAFALRRFAGMNWAWVAAGIGLFLASFSLAGLPKCGTGPCLNGSLGYAPALVALAAMAAVLAGQRHPAWRHLLAASLIFAVSLAARTVDRTLCPHTIIAGRTVGTHALWHLLNGWLLLILLLAAIRHGDRPVSRTRSRPLAKPVGTV